MVLKRIGRWASLWVGAAAALIAAAPARAEWREARSKHFIVYSEGREADLRESATRLEQLDALMRLLGHNATDEADQIANPLTVYVVGDLPAVRRIFGRGGANIGGFYLPRVTGSVAFTPRVTGDDDFTGQLVLFHEYAHHYLLGNTAAPYPAWFSEGYAEFMSTARFTPTQLEFGRPAQHRAETLFAGNTMTAERLLTYGQARLSDADTASLYARGWLLTHYLIFNPDRSKQFDAYIRKVADGMPNADAARAAFGDLRQLNGALNLYLSRNRFDVRVIDRAKLATPPVTIRTLTPAQAAMLPLRMRSTHGVDDKTAGPLFAQATKIAATAADDPVVQGWYAEMAYDAKQDAVADAAADRALAADPKSIQALLYKAHVRLRRAMLAAKEGKDGAKPDPAATAAAWKEARGWIIRANRIANNDAAALSLYYESFLMADADPSKSATDAIYRASVLVPQDPSVRWLAARQHIIDGDVDAAKLELRPIAYNPHAAPDNPAARLVALLDQGVKGKDALAALEKGQADADKSGEGTQ